MKSALLIGAIMFLCSCSAMDLVSGLAGGGGPSLDAELTVGDKNQEVQVGDTAESITNIQEIPLEFMLLMVLGWLLPSPQEIWHGILNMFKRGK